MVRSILAVPFVNTWLSKEAFSGQKTSMSCIIGFNFSLKQLVLFLTTFADSLSASQPSDITGLSRAGKWGMVAWSRVVGKFRAISIHLELLI